MIFINASDRYLVIVGLTNLCGNLDEAVVNRFTKHEMGPPTVESRRSFLRSKLTEVKFNLEGTLYFHYVHDSAVSRVFLFTVLVIKTGADANIEVLARFEFTNYRDLVEALTKAVTLARNMMLESHSFDRS